MSRHDEPETYNPRPMVTTAGIPRYPEVADKVLIPKKPQGDPMASSLEEVLQFRQERFETSTALIRKKGADYNRDQQLSGDTLFNLRVAEIMGLTDAAEVGVLIRLMDKMMRLASLMKPGREAEVKNESVMDTVDDVHNYIDYAALLWQKRRAGKQSA